MTISIGLRQVHQDSGLIHEPSIQGDCGRIMWLTPGQDWSNPCTHTELHPNGFCTGFAPREIERVLHGIWRTVHKTLKTLTRIATARRFRATESSKTLTRLTARPRPRVPARPGPRQTATRSRCRPLPAPGPRQTAYRPTGPRRSPLPPAAGPRPPAPGLPAPGPRPTGSWRRVGARVNR